eukprot:gene6215-10221_t
MKLVLFLVALITLFSFSSTSVIRCISNEVVALEQYSLEYIEQLSPNEQIVEEVVGQEEQNECFTGKNICEFNCKTIPGCKTDKIFHPVLTGYFKTSAEKKAYDEVCEHRGRNDIEGLTYIDRDTPFSRKFRKLLTKNFPEAEVTEAMSKINSDWYFTQAFLIKNQKLIEPYGELLLVLADLKYIYQGIQSVCLSHKDWEASFGELMMKLEEQPLYAGIGRVITKYKTISQRNPKALKATLFSKFEQLKSDLLNVLKSLVTSKKFHYCPCIDLVIYDKIQKSNTAGSKILQDMVKKECGCDFKIPSKKEEEPLGYIEKMLSSSNPNSGSRYIIEQSDELTGAVRNPEDLEKGKGKKGKKSKEAKSRKGVSKGTDFAKDHYKNKKKAPLNPLEKDTNKRLVIILDDCPLEAAKIRNEYVLLNSDDHYKFLLNNKQKPEEYRPDIVHQCLLTLLDSPINKSGHLELYLRTKKNVLIQMNPQVRLPRTYQRFAGLMIQLLQKLKIRASDGNAVLMKVIKNPITNYLPSNCRIIGCSHKAEKTVQLSKYIPENAPDGKPIVFVVGGFAHGQIQADYTDEFICISNYPLSASVVLSKICHACEDFWNIV